MRKTKKKKMGLIDRIGFAIFMFVAVSVFITIGFAFFAALVFLWTDIRLDSMPLLRIATLIGAGAALHALYCGDAA